MWHNLSWIHLCLPGSYHLLGYIFFLYAVSVLPWWFLYTLWGSVAETMATESHSPYLPLPHLHSTSCHCLLQAGISACSVTVTGLLLKTKQNKAKQKQIKNCMHLQTLNHFFFLYLKFISSPDFSPGLQWYIHCKDLLDIFP